MMTRLWRLLRIERNEVPLLTSLFVLHFLVVGAFTLNKAARDSLFLESWPATILPQVNIVLVIWTMAGVWLHARAIRGRSGREALGMTLLLAGLSLTAFYVLPEALRRPAAMLLYFWSATTGLILISQFWLLADESTEPRSARRLYTVISAGGILGGLAGGFLAAFLGRFMGGKGPLLAGGLLCLAAVPMAWREPVRLPGLSGLAPPRPRPATGAGGLGQVGPLLHHPYVRAMAFLMLASGMASAVVDYQFKLTIQREMPAGTELAAFLGSFYGVQSLAALVLQVGFGSVLLSRLGARNTLGLLPAGILAAAAGGMMLPLYPLVAWTRLYDSVLRISVTSTALEFFYFPLPEGLRRKARLFIDSVVTRGSEALAALLILSSGMLFQSRPHALWGVLALLCAAWFLLLWRMGRLYVKELSLSLRRMVMAPPTAQTARREARLLNEIRTMLQSHSPQQALYALDLLRQTDPQAIPDFIPALLKHASAAVRQKAIELALETPEVVDLVEMEELLHDDHQEVAVYAALFFAKLTPGSPIDNLADMLGSADPRVRGSALQVVVEHSEPGEAGRVVQLAGEFLARGGREDRLAVARAIGLRRGPASLDRLLAPLLDDPDDRVRHEALAAAGRAALREHLPLLLGRLADRRDRHAARAALAGYGERVIGTLGDYLVDPTVPAELKRQVPRVLAAIGTQEAVTSLLRAPLHQDRLLDLQVLKALNRMRTSRLAVDFPAEQVSAQVRAEAFDIMRLLVYQRAFVNAPPSPAHALMLRALAERIDHGTDRLFRRLALIYPAREVHLAYMGLSAPDFRTQGQSVEYLAGVLAPADRQAVLPLVDLLPEEERVNNASAFFRFSPRTVEQALEELAEGSDHWLAACALFAIGSHRIERHLPLVRRSVESPEPLVHDTALWAGRRLAPSAGTA